MEAIIRATTVSALVRQLRRPGVAPVAAAAPVPQPNADAPRAPAVAAPAAIAASVSLPVAAPTIPLVEHEAAMAAAARREETLAKRELDREAEAAETKRVADEDLAAARVEAERRGYEAGEERGERAAMEALREQTERVRSLASQLNQAKAAVMEDAEDAVLDLAFAAICRVLGEQAATRETLLSLVRDCMAGARDREQVVVRLHPDDAALVQGADGAAAGPRIVADHTVVLGGCIVDSSTGSLDARLENQVTRLGATLRAVRAARRQAGEAV